MEALRNALLEELKARKDKEVINYLEHEIVKEQERLERLEKERLERLERLEKERLERLERLETQKKEEHETSLDNLKKEVDNRKKEVETLEAQIVQETANKNETISRLFQEKLQDARKRQNSAYEAYLAVLGRAGEKPEKEGIISAGQPKQDKDVSQQEGVEVQDSRELRTVEKEFSKVSEALSNILLTSLRITLINGVLKAPIVVPEGFNCGTFPIAEFGGEEPAHPHFLTFLTGELKAKGVSMDVDGGFQVVDVRRRNLYNLNFGEYDLSGGLDAAIVPWGTCPTLPASQVRCSIELKYPRAAKGPNFFSGTIFGQSCAEVVAAFVYTEYPVLLHVTTSVHESVLLEIRRENEHFVIVYWSGVTFDAVIFKLVEHLKNCNPGLPYFLIEDKEVPDASEIVHWRKKVRLGKGSLLQEQLESLSAIFDNPNERFFHAYDLVRSVRRNEEAPDIWTVPEPVKSVPEGMYM